MPNTTLRIINKLKQEDKRAPEKEIATPKTDNISEHNPHPSASSIHILSDPKLIHKNDTMTPLDGSNSTFKKEL